MMDAAEATRRLERTHKRIVERYGKAIRLKARWPKVAAYQRLTRELAEELEAIDWIQDRLMRDG
jgi:hypothetical protein